jgi:pilus assembly protein FimV
MALGLGRLTVQSALGQPLLAEVDVIEITTAEEASLKVGLASPEAFRAAGVEFNSALTGASITVKKRANGQTFLQLSNTRPVNEPYLDFILEATWASGRIVRDFTMLFDPPSLRTPAPTPLSAVVSPAPSPTPEPATAKPAAAEVPAVVARPLPPVAAQAPVRQPAEAAKSKSLPKESAPKPKPKAVAAKATEPTGTQPLVVKAGDTASKIAAAHLPAGASLDQMLVAMLQSNPQAFIKGNVNRVKAGAIIELPDAAQSTATEQTEAHRVIAAQSRDFNEFRRRLASVAQETAPTKPGHQVTGKVQTEVQDRRPAAQVSDKLTLSKGSVNSKKSSSAEEKIASERQAKDQADRAAELARNIAELAKIGTATQPAAAPTVPAQPAPAPAPVPAPAPTPAPAEPVPPPPAPTAAEAPKPAEPVAAEPKTPAVEATPAPTLSPAAEEPGFLAELTDSPLVLPAAGGLAALLLGFGAYRLRQRRKTSAVDSSYLESRLQPDSFFGASGGQNVDTAEAAPSGSSMMYSPSQLDAGGDVDPVAEADVYLAYGRDLQAEEILKEALRINPTRVAIHSKMLEIYAKRRDVKAFEVLAGEVYALVQGAGPEWEHACTLGQEIDPDNPLYRPGGTPPGRSDALDLEEGSSPGMANTRPFVPSALTDLPEPGTDTGPLDLDLDFDMDAAPTPAPEVPTKAPETDNTLSFNVQSAPPSAELSVDELNSTFGLDAMPLPDVEHADLAFDLPAAPAIEETPVPVSPPLAFDAPVASNDLNLSFDLPEVNPAPVDEVSATEAKPATDGNLMQFDMGDLSLDLGDTPSSNELADIPAGDPLETKLSLAAEFLAIGDMEGARSLAEEVVEQATGALKSKASSFLADLG